MLSSISPRPRLRALLLTIAACAVAACSPEPAQQPDDAAQTPPASAPEPAGQASASAPAGIDHGLVPVPGREAIAPVLTESSIVVFETTAGDVVFEVYPEAAPNAVERFLTLVESGFYDETPVSRVVEGFVAQFGINWREPHRDWQTRNFDDDPSLFKLERGTLAFAKSGPNRNSTQVFINYGDNSHLVTNGNFTTFGEVVEGMEIVDSFRQVGDPSYGLDQGRLWNDGGNYLASLDEQPTMIERAYVR